MRLPSALMSAALLGAIALAAPIRGQTWIGATSTDWNTASNWSPATVPNSTTAVVNFTGTALGTINVSAAVSAGALNFSNTTGNYTITSSAGQTLYGGGAITVAAGVTGIETLNLANIAGGSLVPATAGANLVLTNNSTSANTTLVIGPNTVIGTDDAEGVIVAGPGNTQISGSFASGNLQLGKGLTLAGPGRLTLSGNGSNLAGGLTLNGGIMTLDYSANTASKLGAGSLTLDGGELLFTPNNGTNQTQTVGGMSLSAGHTYVYPTSTIGGITLAAGAISRSAGATADFSSIQAGFFAVTTSTTTTNSLLGSGPAFATVGVGSTWATVSGGAIAGLISYGTNTYNTNVNTDVTMSATETNVTTNSLRFNTSNLTLTLSGTNDLQSGGILVTGNGTGSTITGGTLTVPNGGELIVHAYGNITINSALVSTIGLTRTAHGNLTLGGTNTGLTGPINANEGGLIVTTPAAVNSASQINFNDDGTSNFGGLQQLTVSLGNTVNGTISPPIRLSSFSATDYGTYFSTGSNTGSTITLSGVISSAAGLTTPIRFDGTSSTNSGFNLTNVNNTFMGNVSVYNGATLGITSDLSLGNAANVLVLESGSATAGGLVFLNGGVTVAHNVTVNTPTAIVCNGTDSNTISGVITGAGGIYKAGTGTLTLANGANNVTGGVTVAAGTLSLGATGVLPAGENVIVAAGATFSVGSNPNPLSLGTLTLNGGTFRVPSGSGQLYLVGQIVTNSAGGTVDFTGAGADTLTITGMGGIGVNGNSTWLSPANSSMIRYFFSGVTLPITIPAGVTLSNGIALGAGSAFQITGGGTLFQNSDATNVLAMTSSVTVSSGSTFRVTDASSNGGVGNFGTGAFTLDGGTFDYGGASAATVKPIVLTANGGSILVESAATVLTMNGAITGPGGLTKIGPGTLVLASSGNNFTSLTINAGTVQVASDTLLGAAPITFSPFGTLNYTGTTATTRTFTLNSGTLSVSAGQTVTLNGAAVGGGFMVGPGTFALTGGTTLAGVTTQPNANLSVIGSASMTNVTNGGALTIAGGLSSPTVLSGFTNQGSGAITVGANSQLDLANFQSYGMFTIANGTGSTNTLVTNTGTSPLYFNGGSQTFIGTPATAGALTVGIDLHGQNAVVAGGLFVNNGYVVDSTNSSAVVVADYGALVKGAGFFQNSPVTQNGGRVQAGNSPGSASFGQLTFGPGGVSNYVFAIDDATGTAGPSPNAAGQVSGWGLMKAVQRNLPAAIDGGLNSTSGDFAWNANATDKLAFAIQTLVNPTTVGTDVGGLMADFDPSRSYSWPAVQWAGNYSGPTSVAALDASTIFDTSSFENPIAGTFGWSLESAAQTLSLTYTPSAVPEPGTLALLLVVGLPPAIRRGLNKWRRTA